MKLLHGLSGDDGLGFGLDEPEIDGLGAEKREAHHGRGTATESAEHAHIELDRGEEEDGDPIAEGHALVFQVVREAAGVLGELAKRQHVRVTVAELYPDRDVIGRMSVDALVSDVETLLRTVKERPSLAPVELLPCFVVVAIIERHVYLPSQFPVPVICTLLVISVDFLFLRKLASFAGVECFRIELDADKLVAVRVRSIRAIRPRPRRPSPLRSARALRLHTCEGLALDHITPVRTLGADGGSRTYPSRPSRERSRCSHPRSLEGPPASERSSLVSTTF